MNYEIREIKALIARYKKPLIVVSIGALSVLFLGIGALGLAVYHSAGLVKGKISDLQTIVSQNSAGAQALRGGFVEGLLLDGASSWVRHNLAVVETSRFREGLSCLSSLGGPDPKQVIEHVKTQVVGAGLLASLDTLAASFEGTEKKGGSVNACASLIFRG